MTEQQPDRPTTDGSTASDQRLVYLVAQSDEGTSGDGLDLFELWHVICQGKWLALAVTLFFAVVGAAYALLAPQWYRAEVLLMPVEENSGLAGQLAQFGGLANLMGINLGGGSDSAEAMAV